MAPKKAPKSDEAKEAKEVKAPKVPKRKEAAGHAMFDDADDDAPAGGFKQGKIEAPLDKRSKVVEKEDKVISGGSDAVSGLLKRKDAAKKSDKEKKAEEKKIKEGVKAERMAADGGGDDGGDDDAFQIQDKSGLGNFMDKADVLAIMKNTVSEAVTSSGSRCQVVSKISEGDRIHLGDAKKAPVFESMGGFKTNKGFVYIRGKQDEPGFGIKLDRPCTMYACLSEPPDDGDDSYMRRWEVVSPDELSPPDIGGDLAEIALVKKKKFTDRMGSIPKPPEGYETCLCFIVPDFHAEPFGKEELSKEEQLALDRKNKQAARDEKDKEKADNDKTKPDKKKDEPTEEEQIATINEKVEAGTKLTSKEKKALEQWKIKHPVYEVHAEDRSLVDSSLNAFSVVIEGGCNPPPAGDSLVVESFSLQAPGQHLFLNANFTIAQGKRYGILGPNGQGKTTLLRHIAAREFPVPLNWDVILVEQEAKASNRSAVEEVLAANEEMFKLARMEQELTDKLDKAADAPEGSEGAMSAEECEAIQLELSRIAAELEASGADSAEAGVRKILCGLGFTNGGGKVGSVTDRFSMDRPVMEFSGGWRMRISLAKALYLCPKLLMLDEPTNHLDLDAVLWLDDYLSTKYPHAVIVVSHDADFLDHIVTDILHLENKQLLHYRGDYTSFRKMHQQHAREHASKYKKQQDEIALLKKKGTKKDDAVAQVKRKYGLHALDDLEAKPKDYLVKFNFRGHGMDQSIGGVNVTDVSFSYNGKEPWLLEGCEMGVDCASRIAIVGPNGAGKTTMLNLMLMQLEPTKGEVQIAKGLRVRNYHQHFEELLPFEKDPTSHLRNMYNLTPEKARAVLGQFGLPGASHHTKIGNLSGGQKARVAFGELMLSEPHIMILDEPTNHLDIESVEALTAAISNFNGGLVLVSHDARLITEIDAEIWVVEDGTCYRFEKGFQGYRDKVLKQLEERQQEVERLEAKRREVKAAKRAALVTKEQAEKAQKKAQEEKRLEDERQAALLKQAQADAAVAAAEREARPKAPKKAEVEASEEGSDEDEEKAEKDSEKDSEKGESDSGSDDEDVDYSEKHEEFKVAMLASVRVKKVNAGKKDKEFKAFLCELDIGEDDNISAVTLYANAMAGEKVIVALPGSSVGETKVEAEMVHGEYSQAVICGPKEMGWTVVKSDAAKFPNGTCTILDDSFEVGAFAPKRIKLAKDSAEAEEVDAPQKKKDKGEEPAPQKKKDAPSAVDAKSKKGKKADDEGDDDDEDDDDDAAKGPAGAESDKKKKKGKPGKGEDEVKLSRSAAKKAQEEAEKKEKAEAAPKAKGKKGRNQGADDEDDVPIEKPKAKKVAPEPVKEEAAGGDPNAKHPEYKIAKVIAAEPQKKGGKFIRGSFVVSIVLTDGGGGEELSVITSTELAPGNRVVFAPEGSTVSGKEVKKQKVQGEWSCGVFCTAFDLSWPGDAIKCVLLSDAWTVGEFAPLNAPKDLGVVAVDAPDEETLDDEQDEPDDVDYAEVNENEGKKKGAAKAAPKAKGKAAKGKKGKRGDDDDDDEDQDDADGAGGKPKAKAEPKPKGAPPAPKAKAKGKKGKKGDSDEEFVKKDAPVAVAKKAPAKQADSDSDDAPAPARKGGFAKAGFAAMLDSDEDDADSESEEEVKAPPKKEPAPVAKDKKKKDESDDDDDDKPAKKPAAKEKEKAKPKKKKDESSDEESSDEDEKKKAAERKKALEKLKEKAKGKKKKKADSSDDESSEDEKAKAKRKKAEAKEKEKAKAKKKKESSSDAESSEDEKAKKKKATDKDKAKSKKKKDSSSDEESSEDEKAKKKAAAKEKEKAEKEKAKAKKKKEDKDDDPPAFEFGEKKKDKKDKKEKKADSDSDDDKKKKKEKKDKK